MQKRFLIIRLSSIGDILLTTPFVRALRKKYPDSLINYLTKSEYVELMLNNPNINNVYAFDTKNGFGEILNWRYQIKSNRYNAIFDLHRNIRTLLMTRFIGGMNSGKYNKRYFKRYMLVNFGLNLYKNVTSISDRYLEVGSKYNLADDGFGLDLYTSSDSPLKERLKVDSKLNLVIAPGAGYHTKRWPSDNYAKLADLLVKEIDAKIILVGSKDDLPISEAVISQMNEPATDATGEFTLLETAAIIKQSDAVLTNDSGLMHIAVSQKKPVLAFFGSTTEELGFFPYGDNFRVLEVSNLNCRPCSHVGRDNCPKKHFKCMVDITPELAFKATTDLLEL